MLIKCLAAAALLLPMPLAQVEQKLKEQGFDNKVVAATMVRLRAKGAGRPSRARPAAAPKEAPPAPAPGKPPAEAPPAPPSAEVVEVTDADKVLTPAEAAPAVEVLAETHEEIRTNINDFENGARDFENIARMLEEASAKEKALAAADEELHKRAGQVKSDLDALAGKMEKTAKAAALRERVEEIGGKAQRLLEAISGEAQSLVDSLNKQFDVLHADVSIFDDVPPKLREKVNQLKELDKRLWAGEEAARVLIATGQQEPLLEEYERILAEIRGILKMHEEGPETVLGILPGIIELLSRHDKMLGDWKKVMLMIEMDSKDVQSQFEVERKKEEAEAKARSEQEEEARKRLIDMDKMIANVAQLEKFVNRVNEVKFEGSVKEPVAMLDKSDIGVYRDLADESNGIVVGLRSERVRINDIPSKTAAMDKLLQALADFTQGQFSKDLTDLLKALKSAAGMGQERGARLSGPLLAEFQKKNYPPVLEGVRMTLTAIKDELAREKQELERGATPA
jgi:predicted NUDIX family NTP pyrophosphohydrolase